MLFFLLISLNCHANTTASNCKIASFKAVSNSNELITILDCEEGSIITSTKSDTIKSILLTAKSSLFQIRITVNTKNAFQKNSYAHTLEKIEMY